MGKEIYEFKGRNSLGKIGETVALEYLKTWSTVKDIKDVRNDPEYQKKDIDFVTYLKNNTVVNIEVKTDSYTSGNIFYETISNDVKGDIGCFEKTESDFIFYYFIHPQYRKAYIFNTQTLREWKNKHEKEYKLKKVFNFKYNSFGYAFPLEVLEKDLRETLTIADLTVVKNIADFEEKGRKYWDKMK